MQAKNTQTDKQKPSKLKLGLLLTLPFAALVSLVIAAGSGQVSQAPVEAKLHQVQVSPIKLQPSYLQYSLATGRVEATQQAQLGFELAGKVATTLVDEGELVSKGQVLAELDLARLNAQMLELVSTLDRAQADARLAKLSEQRVIELVSKKLESEQRLDETRETTIAANALVREIQARQNSLQVEIDKSAILAPFDGQILARMIDAGTVVNAGQAIFSMQKQASLEVRIALSAKQAASLNIGEQHQLLADAQNYQAKVKSIAHQRRLDTRTVDVIFALPTDADLLPGDLVSLKMAQNINISGAWVPKQALSGGVRGLWTLYTAGKQGQSNKVVAKAVKAIHVEDERAYVTGALNDGELLIVNGSQRLVPEQLVKVIDANTSIARRRADG